MADEDFDKFRESRGIDEENPLLAAARAEAQVHFDLAHSEIAKFIGAAIIAGKTFPEIKDDLLGLDAQIARDAAIDSTRAITNPFKWVLDEAIRAIEKRC